MTLGKGFFFWKGTNKDAEIFLDADWIGAITNRRSTSSYCTFLWRNLVAWQSKKQYVVSRSSDEAEFRAMAETSWRTKDSNQGLNKDVLWQSSSNKHPKNPIYHDRTKHVEIDHHFIKERIEEGIIKMVYAPTHLQTLDILIKAFPRTNLKIWLPSWAWLISMPQLEGEWRLLWLSQLIIHDLD